MKEIWEERYGAEEYIYGTEPNAWFRQFISSHAPGSLLLAAEGEGRNAVFAARHGWQVEAFDLTTNGKQKAMKLAAQQKVQIGYQTGDALTIAYPDDHFDAVGVFFLHLPANTRGAVLLRLTQFLKPGGVLVMECFSKKHFGNPSGPRNLELLCEKEALARELSHLQLMVFEEADYVLDEGRHHQGPAAVIRVLAVKEGKGQTTGCL